MSITWEEFKDKIDEELKKRDIPQTIDIEDIDLYESFKKDISDLKIIYTIRGMIVGFKK